MSDPATPEQRKILEKAKELDAKRQKVDLNITVDNPTGDELVKLLKDKEEKTPESKDEIIEDLQNKLFFAAQKEIERKRKALGAPPEIDTLEKLKGFEMAKKGESGGVAPLNAQQMGQSATELWKRPFQNMNELLKFLHDNQDDPEAKRYYDEYWKRAIQAMKSREQISYEQPKGDISNEQGEVTIRDWSQLKPFKSEIREALDRANEKAREKIRHEYDRRMKKKEGES
ncbi:MAG: hypothetical protein ABSG57_11210 [Candidatus Bathyarchaeia archaeon]